MQQQLSWRKPQFKAEAVYPPNYNSYIIKPNEE